MLDFYSVLGLSRRANHEEIRAAYWSLAKQSHPDVNVGDQDAEQRIKEINRAYETLGDPDARAAYDLELLRRRTWTRRRFWASAATGAATCILTVGCFGLVMWRQHAERHQLSSSKGSSTIVVSSTRRARNEDLQARLPADQRAGAPTAELANAKRINDDVVDAPSEPVNTASNEGLAKKSPVKDRASVSTGELASASGNHPLNDDVVDTPSEPVSTAGNEEVAKPPAELANAKGSHALRETMNPPAPEPIGESPTSANVEVASGVLRWDAETPGKRALLPSAVRDGSPDAELQNELSGTVQVLEGQRVPPARAGNASPAIEHANGSEPEVGPRPPMSVAAVDPPSGGTVVPHEQPSTAPSGPPRTKKSFYKTANPRTPMQGKPQVSEQASRLVAKNAMALRFPSADEPYVNVGARDR